MGERYYVDERVGCMAVRDRTKKSDRPCLDNETAGVVKFWRALRVVDDCPTCGHRLRRWKMSHEFRTEANLLCAKMNDAREANDET